MFKGILSLFIVALFLSMPSWVGRQRLIFVHEPITVKIQRSSPAHILFEEITAASPAPSVTSSQPIYLAAGSEISAPGAAPVLSDSEDVAAGLSEKQKLRLELAQAKHRVLEQDWSAPQLHEVVESALRAVPEKFKRELSPSEDLQAAGQKKIVGQIEISGGLAVTNEHHLEVRRANEGVVKELGKVDLSDGTYEIQVEDLQGSIQARLIDISGRILGEDTIRLSSLAAKSGLISGPRLRLEPKKDFGGTIASSHRASERSLSAPAKVSSLKGAVEKSLKDGGDFSLSEFAPGSSALVEVSQEEQQGVVTLASTDKELKLELMSKESFAMMLDLINAQVKETNILPQDGRVILGRIEGLANPSGLKVVLESEPSLKPIYFNSMMLPDASQESMGESGYFIFIDVPTGFHSIRLLRGFEQISYQNTYVKPGLVSLVDVSVTTKSELVPVQTFDAFTGEPIAAKVDIQGASQELELPQGRGYARLPLVAKMGLITANFDAPGYSNASYLYSDLQDFVHLPALREEWLVNLRASLRLSDSPQASAIVGFVPEMNYEVYVAGEGQVGQVLYFDREGRYSPQATQGGGFVIFDLEPDVHEVVIVPKSKDTKLITRVVPVDPNSLTVFTVR